jgi:hypothetical protein
MTELTQQLLGQEAKVRGELSPADYERAVCAMLNDVAAPPHSEERIHAFLALAGVTLRQGSSRLVELWSFCAEHLLSVRSQTSKPELRRRIESLFLLAWLQLSAIAERGPEAISASPPLPYGVALPFGANPEDIADPELRKQARELAARWGEEVERWRAKQRAIDEQTLLATLIGSATSQTEDDVDSMKVLAASMALASGVPFALRKSLEDLAR